MALEDRNTAHQVAKKEMVSKLKIDKAAVATIISSHCASAANEMTFDTWRCITELQHMEAVINSQKRMCSQKNAIPQSNLKPLDRRKLFSRRTAAEQTRPSISK
jgi:hypothetical protein